MKTLCSKLACRVVVDGVMVCPGANPNLSEDEIKKVLDHKDGKVLESNGDFAVATTGVAKKKADDK